jgi:hypothetical protein
MKETQISNKNKIKHNRYERKQMTNYQISKIYSQIQDKCVKSRIEVKKMMCLLTSDLQQLLSDYMNLHVQFENQKCNLNTEPPPAYDLTIEQLRKKYIKLGVIDYNYTMCDLPKNMVARSCLPHTGAKARIIFSYKGLANYQISTYLDVCNSLGIEDGPYFEVLCDGETTRFTYDEQDKMYEHIHMCLLKEAARRYTEKENTNV